MAQNFDQSNADYLFEVRNSFYMGNYQQCIKEAQKLKSTADERVKLMRDVFMYRAYICQKKYRVILDEISASSPPELQAVRLFAEFMNSENQRPKIVSQIEDTLKRGSPEFANNIFYLIAAHIFIYEGNMEKALRTLQNGAAENDLECEAAIVQCLLKIDREDLAVKQVKKMQEKDEDAILTQLALAWTYKATGKDKLQDAFYIYQEMIDKYGGTPLLLNAQACVLIMQEKYEQADKLLQEAMDKDNSNPETLINLVLVSRHLGKPFELCNRYINQLKDAFPQHPWTKDYSAKENEFTRICGQYQATEA